MLATVALQRFTGFTKVVQQKISGRSNWTATDLDQSGLPAVREQNIVLRSVKSQGISPKIMEFLIYWKSHGILLELEQKVLAAHDTWAVTSLKKEIRAWLQLRETFCNRSKLRPVYRDWQLHIGFIKWRENMSHSSVIYNGNYTTAMLHPTADCSW